MKYKLIIVMLILLYKPVSAQQKTTSIFATDSVAYVRLHEQYRLFEETQKDSALKISRQMLALASKQGQHYSQVICLAAIGYQLMGLGDYSASLDTLLMAKGMLDFTGKISNTWSVQGGTLTVEPSDDQKKQLVQSYVLHLLGNLMFYAGNINQSLLYYIEARSIALQIGNRIRVGMASMNIGRSYLKTKNFDSASIFLKESEAIALTSNTSKYLGTIYTLMGDAAFSVDNESKAFSFYKKAIEAGKKYNNLGSLVGAYYSITKFYLERKKIDSSIYYARQNLNVISKIGSSYSSSTISLGLIYENLYKSYLLSGQQDSAIKYQGITYIIKDSTYQKRINSLTDFQNTLFQNQLKLQTLEKERFETESRNRMRLFIICILFVLIIVVFLYRNNLVKKRDNAILQQTLQELKSTQSQLIQSEKMASLGELTAGIAHEIQNPLNFVNNFSEVSNELIDEMKKELDKGEMATAKEIAEDVKQNLEKITHHGKRADSIVKGMLQHSRSSTGQKELTDINALCDEYLRLAYHGIRAKDSSFNVTLETDFDGKVGHVLIQPQEMGRVILNLINNALYAVGEKKKGIADPYTPTVKISTIKKGQYIEIRVADNGKGIPASVKEKIFQPFFTTKPTGQGTGLGLSLSYDIVKAHGGSIAVESAPEKGTVFVIQIPVS